MDSGSIAFLPHDGRSPIHSASPPPLRPKHRRNSCSRRVARPKLCPFDFAQGKLWAGILTFIRHGRL